MARECIGCLYDQPMDGSAHHREDWGDGTYYRVVCTRGPIERELRAFDPDMLEVDGLTEAAVRVIDGAYHQHREWSWQRDRRDLLSEAIEAAAELGL